MASARMAEVAERTELITPGPAEALAGLLGVPGPDLADGQGLPLLWHWVYLLDRPPQATLGPDGHPRHGISSPPRPGLRRMFAGGRVTSPPASCEYSYRLVAPLFEGQGLAVSAAVTGDVTRMTTRDSRDRRSAVAALGPAGSGPRLLSPPGSPAWSAPRRRS